LKVTAFWRLTAKKNRFWSLLILLISVVSIRRKLLKRLILKNVVSIQIQKIAIYNSYCKIINLITNKSFRYYNLKSATCNHSKHRDQRHMASNYSGVLSALYTKRILNIKYIRMFSNFLPICYHLDFRYSWSGRMPTCSASNLMLRTGPTLFKVIVINYGTLTLTSTRLVSLVRETWFWKCSNLADFFHHSS